MSQTPFETDEQGNYLLIEPVEGVVPDSHEITLSGRTWRLSDFQGKHFQSHVQPDVLAYSECESL